MNENILFLKACFLNHFMCQFDDFTVRITVFVAIGCCNCHISVV